jgi:hypothetical protein
MILNRLRTNWQQLGSFNGTLYSLSRFLNKISGGRIRLIRYILVAQPVPDSPATIPTKGKLLVRQVAEDDPMVAIFPRPKSVIERRFKEDTLCFVADIDGKFAGFIWLAFNYYNEDEVRCRYELINSQKSAWDYDVYVAPEFRLGRTFSRLWATANTEMSKRGIRWCFSRISVFNT